MSIDESSTKGERKQYHEMLDFAKSCAGKVAIIVNYVDRLQRSYDDTYELNKLRKEGKIEIHFLKEDLIITKDSAAMDLTFWNMHVLINLLSFSAKPAICLSNAFLASISILWSL